MNWLRYVPFIYLHPQEKVQKIRKNMIRSYGRIKKFLPIAGNRKETTTKKKKTMKGNESTD